MDPGSDYVGITTPFYCHDGNGNIVMQKRGDAARDENGRWDPGSGKLEKGLTLEENVEKEVREEYSCECEVQESLPPHGIFREQNGEKTHWLAIPFIVKVDREEVVNGEPEKFDEIRWFPIDDLPENLHTGFKDSYSKYKNKIIDAIKPSQSHPDLDELETFFEDINEIKHKERRGWKKAGKDGVTDTIASHSYGTALLAWILTEDSSYDTERAIKTMLIHDLIMAHLKDLTPDDENFNIKKQLEDERSDNLMDKIPNNIREEFESIYYGFREQESDLARFCREVDKIETLMQAKKYSKVLEKDILDEFLQSYSDQFSSETGTDIFRKLDETDPLN